MKRLGLLIGCTLVGIASLAGCGGSSAGDIAMIRSQDVVADVEMLAEVAKDFYSRYPDRYDMLVMWGGSEFAPGHSFYWPVKNDVGGIGYEKDGAEIFDDSADFGSVNLQGIIWMGPDWISNEDEGQGPRSVLGILAQETGHRWAATMRFRDAALGTDSAALLEDSCHWNRYLDTGASPMGGNQWDPLGDSLYRSFPVDHVEYCGLDLYAMGLIAAEDVNPVRLLVGAHSPDVDPADGQSKVISRLLEPVTVEADVREIAIGEIIEALGERDPEAGFNAREIRQAWIYVYHEQNQPIHSGLDKLVQLKYRWGDFFSEATGGRALMQTTLR